MKRRYDYDIFSEAGSWGFTIWHNVRKPEAHPVIDLRQDGFATYDAAQEALFESAALNHWQLIGFQY